MVSINTEIQPIELDYWDNHEDFVCSYWWQFWMFLRTCEWQLRISTKWQSVANRVQESHLETSLWVCEQIQPPTNRAISSIFRMSKVPPPPRLTTLSSPLRTKQAISRPNNWTWWICIRTLLGNKAKVLMAPPASAALFPQKENYQCELLYSSIQQLTLSQFKY
jgi:hypothetical protein